MRRLLYISICVMFACNSNDKAKTSDPSTTIPTTFDKPPAGYTHLDGTIGNEQTQVNLLITNDGIRGSYTKADGRLTHLYSINYQNNTDSILLLSLVYQPPSSDLPQEDTFRLVYKENGLIGNFYPAKGEKATVNWKVNYPAGSIAVESKTIKDSMVFKEGPAAYLIMEYMLPGKDLSQPLKDSLNKWFVVSALADAQTNENDMDLAVKKYAKSYLSEYERDVNGMMEATDDDDFSSPIFQYNQVRSMNVLYNQNDIFVFSNYIFDYSGGAHPNHVTAIKAIDLKAGKILTWTDVFSVEPKEMRSLVERYFRKHRGMKPDEPLNSILFENHLDPNQNFYITHGGIGFWYVPYEIAAYVHGDTELFIPMEDLRPYLTESFQTRMGKTP